jgi:gamma-glutamyl-gamma-aminobutyrate hydrolase PuuD
VKQGSRFAVGKHHKSNFEDGRRLKKLLEGKEAFKSNSIHKIEGINSLAKYHKAIEEPPSRNTI